jgi:hypothetical protein
MATSFINAALSAVGTTLTALYTVPNDKKAVLIGCNAANITGGILPFSLVIRKGGTDFYLRKDKRVINGGNEEIVSGKVVMQGGDMLLCSAGLDESFDVVASILLGVS